jgi:arginyl-tRNA synthetase
MERFAKLAADALNQALSQTLETPVRAADLETPPDRTMGDFGFPCFRLSKQLRKGPPQVAQQIVAELESKGALPAGMKAAAVGPYVNFTVEPRVALQTLLKDILAGPGIGTYGSLPAASRGSWVLEFSSPNVAKPLNIYHLRTTALGAALARIGRYRGYNVKTINHLGDWGKQYGMLAVAFRHFGKKVTDPITMAELVDLYVKINAEAEKNPKLNDEAREAFLKLEQGDSEITAFWKKCVDISMAEFDRIYSRLGVSFDHIWGESYYKDMLTPMIEDMRKKGVLVESEGAWVIPVKDAGGKDLPPTLIVKSDGATIYATRDMAAAIYRMEKFHFDRMTYIVGGEQKLHFQQIFAALKVMNMSWAERCEHVPTGLYRFKDAKMSTRKGNFVTLEEVIELAKERVRELMHERAKQQAERAAGREPDGTAHAAPGAQELEHVAEAVAVGAVVFFDLSTDPARDVEFDVNRVVDFEGETGPYLQYAHTRCLSILRKARDTGELKSPMGEVHFDDSKVALLTAPEEIALVKTLGQFPVHLERTLSFAKASQLTSYMIDVTKSFGAFYRECHVLGEGERTSARLMLVEATRRVLAQGLGLIGIPLPERM